MKRLIALALLAFAFVGTQVVASDIPLPGCYPCPKNGR